MVTGVVPSYPSYVPSLLSRMGFRIPTARRDSWDIGDDIPENTSTIVSLRNEQKYASDTSALLAVTVRR